VFQKVGAKKLSLKIMNFIAVNYFYLIKELNFPSWYVDKGEFLYRWIDTETADVIEQKLVIGDTVRQRPGQPHQLEALTDGVIFEVSTKHSDLDSYRVWKGDSQK